VGQNKTWHYLNCTFAIVISVITLLTFYPGLTVHANADQDSAATYKSKCSLCHGPDGAGSAVGKTMKVPDLRSDVVQKKSDGELAQAIADGRGGMPPFKSSISEDQIHGLVTYIRSLAPKK
jgi:cytochrome c6